jgi:hypothetical protein
LSRTGGNKWVPVILLAFATSGKTIDQANATLESITVLNKQIDRLRLTDIHTRKPLLDGKKLCELYGIKPGKIVGSLTSELF